MTWKTLQSCCKNYGSLVALMDFAVPCRCPYFGRARPRAGYSTVCPSASTNCSALSPGERPGPVTLTVKLQNPMGCWGNSPFRPPLSWSALSPTFPWSSTDCLAGFVTPKDACAGRTEALNGRFTTNSGNCCPDKIYCYFRSVRI